ncbi:XRE family transcriptional regulator [Neptuniibacter sp. CAU 1671]|uniref:XRE family transcriptional regulator n=1 Tax=Neptuniibacter sp. CAU 1671 TaxID=3032593 RepID=UPI0023DC5B9A|nr:XRE family transcriptional regulator [Neptuniibacter sp. CAU 1671]MDF2181881.1 XRE family transcriptional regulator [Neptuniibacter sp. CAU 1671]
MSTANINTAMLSWARERSGIIAPQFAKKCGVSLERLQEWESGKKPITFNQAMRFSEKAYIPFGFLFLEEPPEESLPIPDLRTVDSNGVDRPSAELMDLLKLMLQRQAWFKEYLKLHLADPISVVGKFSARDSVQAVVADMRSQLQVAEHPVRGKWEDYYRDLVKRVESLGILVMRQSNLGHHTRPLQVKEFRGFAIVDEYAPILFVNHADAPGARLFTLIHELCHIWIGQSGVSDGSTHSQRQEEVFCNAVAAEFLVPANEFRDKWLQDLVDWQDNLPALEAHFHVSKWVLARRALTLGFIDEKDYVGYISKLKEEYKNRDKSGSGPTYYKAKKAQISQTFSKAVVGEALNGQLLLREASELLGGIKPSKISVFAKELGI